MDDFVVNLKKMHPEAKVPFYATAGSAGCDFYATETAQILPGETKKIKTGIALEIPQGFVLKLEGRSGLSSKGILKAGGIIDSDYRGEIQVLLHNSTTQPFAIEKGDRIAQGVFSPVPQAQFRETEELSDTQRGTGGFESTGKR